MTAARMGRRGAAATGRGFSPLGISWHSVYWADRTTLTDGAPVAQWDDLSGNGRHLVAEGTAPTFVDSGLNGRRCLQQTQAATGTSVMRSPNFTGLTQPGTVVLVAAYDDALTSTNRYLVAGAGREDRWSIRCTGPEFRLFAGVDRPGHPSTSVVSLHVATFNSSSSAYWLNGAVASPVDAGSYGLSRLLLFNYSSPSGTYLTAMRVAFFGLLDRAITESETVALGTWSQTHYATP